MSAAPDNLASFGPEWCSRLVTVIHGLDDTRLKTGEDYDTRTLASVFTMEPGAVEKSRGEAIIPSSYHDYDARVHKVQEARGAFLALVGDIDHGDHPRSLIESLVHGFVKDCAFLIYSTANARAGDMRWRIIVPLDSEAPFAEWYDAQSAFFDYMDEHGVEMDRALSRPGQFVYLPNVPPELRSYDDSPLYYERSTSGTNAPGLDLGQGVPAHYLAEIRKRREADERARERIRKEAAERRAAAPAREGASIIDDFNRSTTVETLLELYGYERSPRNSDDWRSPKQTSGSYATRVMGDKWVSLSGSDAGARIGEPHKLGCFGDAYDLFVHYEHGGDHKAAYRALYAERRAAQPLRVSEPPPAQPDDPGPEPIEGYEDAEADMEAEFGVGPEDAAGSIRTVDAFDFDEELIPPRPWVIPGVMLSGYTHMLAAPGGSGKSLFTLQIAVTLAQGKAWGTFKPRRQCRSLVINVEDDLDEQRRRLAAARRVMGGDDLLGWIDIVPDPHGIVVAGRSPDGRTIRTMPVVEALTAYIIEHKIDVLIVDPFAETFEGDENDNSEIKWAMRIWRDEIARKTGCVVYLVHHTTKYAANGAGDANVIRGGGAITNSTRIAATLMPMTVDEANMLGVEQEDRHFYVRYDDAKANQSLKTNTARWFRKETVELDNATDDCPADHVGALVPWTPPDAFDGLSTHSINIVLDKIHAGMDSGERYTASTKGGSKSSGRWAGCLLIDHFGLKEAAAKKVIATWIKTGVLLEDEYQCPVQRRPRTGLFAPESNRPGAPE